MSSSISVTELPSLHPNPSTSRDHHVGSPPTYFKNPWPSFREHGKWELFKLRFGNNPDRNFVPVPEGPDGARSDELVKVLKPDWGASQRDKLRATWIGHATFLVETATQPGAERGVRVLFDPVFSERTSPFSFAGPKRYTPTPCTLDELPDVDIICISHDHYDHLDYATITTLYQRLKGRLHFCVGLNLKAWFLQNIGCASHEVTELDWWDSREVHVQDIGSTQLTCCPTQHFSGRTGLNNGSTLWCSWALKSAEKKLYFAGDTAYQAAGTPSSCPIFKQIGEALGPFDLSLQPIGLYSPPQVSGAVHVTPEQSLEIHKEVRSKLTIGMHYGTVRGGLSMVFEPVQDPPRRWREAAEKEGIWSGGGVEGDGSSVDVDKEGVGLCHVGETVAV
jgi:L-ascorbate metabolism protein UlaG (beta-lactamase superfamily)